MDRRGATRSRMKLHAAVRAFFGMRGFEEVETPCMVAAPAMEPHIRAFETPFVPEQGGTARTLWLRSSPEYAMKRLLAEGFPRIFELARVFRNGELSSTHNPEFTLLEFYRAGTDYRGIMSDLEDLVAHSARAMTGDTRIRGGDGEIDLATPFERLTVSSAFRTHAGIDLQACAGDVELLRTAMVAQGIDGGHPGDSYDDLFFRVFLDRIEPALGQRRPVFLIDWPAPMAALAKLSSADRSLAERFELYAGGFELANGYSELTDPAEQRQRLEAERSLREKLGRPVYPIDERFLEALPNMPEAGGVAVGLDRLLMLLIGAERIEDVLLFPAGEFFET